MRGERQKPLFRLLCGAHEPPPFLKQIFYTMFVAKLRSFMLASQPLQNLRREMASVVMVTLTSSESSVYEIR